MEEPLDVYTVTMDLCSSSSSTVVRRREMQPESLLYFLLLCAGEILAKPMFRKERIRLDPELNTQIHEENQSFQMDHEAFLGKDEAKTFDQLTSEESKDRLGNIVDRIDSDSNGLISTEELTAWIKRVQKRYVYENVARVWKDYDVNNDNHISWEEYKQATYGYYLANPEEFQDAAEQFSFKKMLPRDERRFKQADLNGDLEANREEFTAFLHPEEFEHMKDIVILETLEDIDKNGDGFVDEDEYIGAGESLLLHSDLAAKKIDEDSSHRRADKIPITAQQKNLLHNPNLCP
ncbi:unnamed protein product [Ranitomeya imitator]|uniref:EF-hand domain-containing protein n=1 Tax=Ranitomeya imitator TaxID=111125 RepID=A0ABN9MCK1_9NEOB|nr:unnamed protein product [Ranitomeya imitator]